MSTLAWAVLLGQLTLGQTSLAPTEPPALKGYHEYSRQANDLLRSEATADDLAARAAAIRGLAALYGELSADPRLEASDTLRELRAKLWSRLTRVKIDLQRQIARDDDRLKKARQRGEPVESASLTTHQHARLALAAQLAEWGASLGGATSLAAGDGAGLGGRAVLQDHGQALVDLIEKTIAPQKWDVNGGPFTIVYYAPLHVLVVRASAEVHGDVGGLLGGLRAAGN